MKMHCRAHEIVRCSKMFGRRSTRSRLSPYRLHPQVMAAALSDPDAQPMTPDDFKRMQRTPRVKIIRRALGLTQEEFAARFRIPLGMLRDWEQGPPNRTPAPAPISPSSPAIQRLSPRRLRCESSRGE